MLGDMHAVLEHLRTCLQEQLAIRLKDMSPDEKKQALLEAIGRGRGHGRRKQAGRYAERLRLMPTLCPTCVRARTKSMPGWLGGWKEAVGR